MTETTDRVSISSGALTAEISLKGAELQRLVTAAGEDLQWSGDPAVWKGRAPILFPVIGVLNGDGYRLDGKAYPMPKHGFARDFTFDLAEQAADRAVFRLDANPTTQAIYPFAFRLEIAFAVSGARLDIETTVANRGKTSMPASFGFHPALRWPLPFGQPRADHRLTFEQDEPAPMRRIDGQGLLRPASFPSPIEGRTLALRDDLFTDDALIFDRIASRGVRYGAQTGPQIEIAFPDFAMLGVWTKPGAGFVCIEPWAGIADPEGFEGDFTAKPGVFTVAPGETRRLAMSIALLAQP